MMEGQKMLVRCNKTVRPGYFNIRGAMDHYLDGHPFYAYKQENGKFLTDTANGLWTFYEPDIDILELNNLII